MDDDENIYELVPTPSDRDEDPQVISMTFRAPHMEEAMTRTATGYLVQMGYNVGVSKLPQAQGTEGLCYLIPGSHLLCIDFQEGSIN
tara:strand:- start:174 stop:434 length:261 start_codon:yes stop_codon:yes gene_type:complete